MKDESFHKLTSEMTLWVCAVVLFTFVIGLCATYVAELREETQNAREDMVADMKISARSIENYMIGIENTAKTATLLAQKDVKDEKTHVEFEEKINSKLTFYGCRIEIFSKKDKVEPKEAWDYSFTKGERHWTSLYDSKNNKKEVACYSLPIYNNKQEKTSILALFISSEVLDSIIIAQKPDLGYDISVKTAQGQYLVLPGANIPKGDNALVENTTISNGWKITYTYPKHQVTVLIIRRLAYSLVWMFVVLIVISLTIVITIHQIGKPYIIEQTEESKARAAIEKELSIAANIQKSILQPFSEELETEGCKIYAMSKSARFVGGDLYDFYVHNGKLLFCIGDVSGKGTMASLIMLSVINLFRHKAHNTDNPSEIASDINYILSLRNENCIFTTMFVGIYNPETRLVTYCCAGHNPPIIVKESGETEYMSMEGCIPLGITSDTEFTNETVSLSPGDMMMLYTDGITEATNKEEELYNDNRTLDFAKEHNTMNPKEFTDSLISDVAKFVDGAEQSDDITIMCIKTEKKYD